MTPVSTPVEVVPDEVRELVREQFALDAEIIKSSYLANAFRKGDLDKQSDFVVACACVMADRAIRPASPPRADAGEVERLRRASTLAHQQRRRLWNMAEGLEPDDCEEGQRCRDCGDFDGRCQGDGLPCDPQERAEELIRKMWPTLAAQPAEAVRASQEERDRIAEDEMDRLYRKANADYIEAQTRGDKIAEELHSAAAFWLGENGGKSEANRAAARQARRDQRGGDGV